MEVDVEGSLVNVSSDLDFLGVMIWLHGISLFCKQNLGSKVVTLLTYPTGTGGEFIVVPVVPGHREGPSPHNHTIL